MFGQNLYIRHCSTRFPHDYTQLVVQFLFLKEIEPVCATKKSRSVSMYYTPNGMFRNKLESTTLARSDIPSWAKTHFIVSKMCNRFPNPYQECRLVIVETVSFVFGTTRGRSLFFRVLRQYISISMCVSHGRPVPSASRDFLPIHWLSVRHWKPHTVRESP